MLRFPSSTINHIPANPGIALAADVTQEPLATLKLWVCAKSRTGLPEVL